MTTFQTVCRGGSRILVRGAQQSFDPKGGPEPKIFLKIGFFPLKLLEILGARGKPGPQGPLDPQLVWYLRICCLSRNRLGIHCWGIPILRGVNTSVTPHLRATAPAESMTVDGKAKACVPGYKTSRNVQLLHPDLDMKRNVHILTSCFNS